MRLLGVLADMPDASFAFLATTMYGRDDRSAKSALSAEFSGLKDEKLVEPIENAKGRFRLTELAKRALAAKEGRVAAE